MMARSRTRAIEFPPLRAAPDQPDAHDDKRVEYVLGLWHAQDDALRSRDRQIEQNLRMLAGQQWIVWSEARGRYIDARTLLNEEERRWRHLPVTNRIFLWFMLLHARMTENPPILGFQAGPDRIDSELAEVMDPVWKHTWNEAGMLDVVDELAAWMIPSGQSHLKSRIDPDAGPLLPIEGPAILSLMDPTGGNPIERFADRVPYDEQGNPQAELIDDPETGDYAVLPGSPVFRNEGGIVVDVLPAPSVRGEWNMQKMHRKRWHIHLAFLTPEEAFDLYGVELEPDITGQAAEGIGTLERLLRGGGTYGAASGRDRGVNYSVDANDGYVSVYEFWHRPSRLPGLEEGPGKPGGRLLTVTGGRKVLRDGPRYAAFEWTSPIRTFEMVRVPGRPAGSSPQEMLNGPQMTRNRLDAQILQHSTLVANPIQMIDTSSGLKEGQVKNLPGQQVEVNMRDMKGDPIRYAVPPNLQDTVFRARDLLTSEIDDLGNIAGAQGNPPTESASGRLVEELRFNADRFVGPTMRRMTVEMARLAQDWKVMIPLIWTQEKVIKVAGDDNIQRVITLYPELFEKGTVNVVPELESMLPEGRGERQARVRQMYADGIYGAPGSFEAVNAFLDLARFPHMGRATRPGGVDRVMAEQNVGKLLQGTPATGIPILPMYDLAVHRFVLERFMKSPEYLRTDPAVQAQCYLYWELLRAAQAQQAQMLAMEQANTMAVQGTAAVAAEGAVQGAAAATGVIPIAQGPPQKGATRDALPAAG